MVEHQEHVFALMLLLPPPDRCVPAPALLARVSLVKIQAKREPLNQLKERADAGLELHRLSNNKS